MLENGYSVVKKVNAFFQFFLIKNINRINILAELKAKNGMSGLE